ncbi:hypothetical protein Tco_1445424 [Tanacetum coccineum]
MANVPEIIVDGSVAQLTRAIASGISGSIPRGLVNCVVSRDVVESFRRDMGGDVVYGSVSDSVSQGVGSHVMVNGFVESGMGNDVNESVFQGIAHGMVGGVRARSVDGIGAANVRESGILNGVRVHVVNGMRVSGVNESIVVNDVRANDSVRVTGASSVTETVMVDTVRDNGVSGVRINGVNESVVVNDVRAVSNDVRTNSGVGVTWVSSVSETIMVDAIRCNDVIGVRINGVNDSVMVNDVRPNGVGGSVYRGMGDGVRTNGGVGVTDGSGSSLGQAPVDHIGQLDKDCLLGWFNQEVVEDLGRLREYRSVACGFVG